MELDYTMKNLSSPNSSSQLVVDSYIFQKYHQKWERYCYEKGKKKKKEEDILSFQNIDWTLISPLCSSSPFFKYFLS